jgi:hypothetical protein
MRAAIWTLVAVGLAASGPFVRSSDRQAGTGEDWCRDGDRGSGRARYCEVRDVALQATGAVRVDARPNGGVDVRGWDRNEIRLQAKVVATADTEGEAKALASQVRIESAGMVRAVGPERGSRDEGWSVSFRLEVPRSTDLRLQADNGGISVRDVAGTSELDTVNGGLHLEGLGGHVRGRSVNGGVHLALSGTEWEGEGLDVRTTNGGVHLTIPAGYNARLEMGTVNGGVHTDLPVTGRQRYLPGGRIETDLGRGGNLVHVETTNGGLHVDQR